MSIDEEFVLYIIKSLVEYPEDVSVRRSVDEKGVLLELSVHSGDLGRVIGREGSTAKAIRTLLKTLGGKVDKHFSLKIIDQLPGIHENQTL